LRSGDIGFYILPGAPSGNYWQMKPEAKNQLVALLLFGRPIEEPEGTIRPERERVTVKVWNASGRKGVAYRLTKFLRQCGYDVVDWGNYSMEQIPTRVVDRRGNIGNAQAVAGDLGVESYHSEPNAKSLVDDCVRQHDTPPGFGHRFHTRDPRAARLFQMALELELEGEHVRLIRATARALEARKEQIGYALPVNVDGAIAAICADLGFAYELGNAVFLISRLPGLIAHAHEERARQTSMRQIDPKDHDYDGAQQRRLPEGRK